MKLNISFIKPGHMQKDSTHPDFNNYNNDQETMYNAIVEAYSKAGNKFNINHIVPTGTAIQNGRNTFYWR